MKHSEDKYKWNSKESNALHNSINNSNSNLPIKNWFTLLERLVGARYLNDMRLRTRVNMALASNSVTHEIYSLHFILERDKKNCIDCLMGGGSGSGSTCFFFSAGILAAGKHRTEWDREIVSRFLCNTDCLQGLTFWILSNETHIYFIMHISFTALR